MSRHGAPTKHLFRIYISFIRPNLEYGAPVWHFGLTVEQTTRLEKIQKRALIIASKVSERSYEELLREFEITSLHDRRLKLCMEFGVKSLNHSIVVILLKCTSSAMGPMTTYQPRESCSSIIIIFEDTSTKWGRNAFIRIWAAGPSATEWSSTGTTYQRE